MSSITRVLLGILIGCVIGFVVFSGATFLAIRGIPEEDLPGPNAISGLAFVGLLIGGFSGGFLALAKSFRRKRPHQNLSDKSSL